MTVLDELKTNSGQLIYTSSITKTSSKLIMCYTIILGSKAHDHKK